MDFSAKHVVVTGGTGALGTAGVGALLRAGANCTVSYRVEAEAQRFLYGRQSQVKLIKVTDLSDESEVRKLYSGLTPWASILIAGGFAMGKVAETDKAALMGEPDPNLIACFFCCR